MIRPKLSYFDFPGGRGEDCRLALYLAEVDFEDDRVPPKDWPDQKFKTPFGAMPVLHVEGMGDLAQSNAILTYIGREHGLHPEDPWEAAQHESVMASVEDVRARVAQASSDDEDAKKSLREGLADGWLRHWSETIDEMVQGPFLAGDRMNVADLKLFNIMNWVGRGGVDYIAEDYFDQFDRLAALRDAVASLDSVVEWYSD